MLATRFSRYLSAAPITAVALICGFAAAAANEPEPHGASLEPHRAVYDVRISVLRGEMVTELMPYTPDSDGDQVDDSLNGAAGETAIAPASRFVGTSEISPRGLARLVASGTIENRSVFRVSDQGVQPLAFEGRDDVSKRKKQATLNFDWDTGRLTGTASQKEDGERIETDVDVAVVDGLHDAISLQYALMYDLQNGGLRSQYTLADGDEQKTINVTQLDTMTLRVPYGEFEVLPVQHQAETSSRVTTFWLAKDLNYLPVKIEQWRKGKRLMKAELGDYRLPSGAQQ